MILSIVCWILAVVCAIYLTRIVERYEHEWHHILLLILLYICIILHAIVIFLNLVFPV